MGRTRIYYERSPREEFLEEIVFNFDEQKELYETLIRRRSGSSGNRESGDSGGGNSGGLNKGYGKQISEAFGEFICDECHGVMLKVFLSPNSEHH